MTGEVADTIQTARPPLPGEQVSAAPLWVAAIASLAIIGAALIALYWNEVVGAVSVWSGSTAYNHGFLIIPIAGYLIWERRATLWESVPQPLPWVLPLVAGVGALWLVADLVGVLEAQQMLLIGLVQLALLAVLGRRIYGALCLPFLYLFFLVPTGEFLVPYLQDFTARFVVSGLHLSGIPVYSDGFLISIPNESFYVAEACAGLRFLIATIAFGVLFSDFAYRSLARKIAFLVLCVVAPVIANGIRAYGIILIAYLTDGKVAAGVDHILYGWIFFSIVTLALMGLGWIFREAAPTKLIAVRPDHRPASRTRIATVAAILVCLVAAPRGYAAFLERSAAGHGQSHVVLPDATAPWTAEAASGMWRPSFPKADVTVQLGFRDAGRRVDLFVAYYAHQDQNKKLVSATNRLADGDWDVSNRSSTIVTVAGERIPVAVTEFTLAGRKRVVLSTYWVDNRFEASAIFAKLWQAKAAITGERSGSSMIALSTDVGDDLASALGVVVDFAAHLQSLRPNLQSAANG